MKDRTPDNLNDSIRQVLRSALERGLAQVESRMEAAPVDELAELHLQRRRLQRLIDELDSGD